MSFEAGADARDAAAPRDGAVAALRESSVLRAPVESHGGHDHDTDHLALLYDDRDEQLALAAQFLRQGLERGERCVYVADDNDPADVTAALRECGVDVDAERERGALAIHSPDDTYRRTGAFEREAMLEFWEQAHADADDEDYAGIRAAAEMTWVLEDETSGEALVEYEAVLNDLYEGDDYVVCCQYNVERFAPEVVRDVVRTHPFLIEDGVLHDNVFYTPPAEFFAPETPADEVERMLGTLRERTAAKADQERATDRFQTIVENSQDAILIVDPHADELVEANPAACEMLGYDRAELLSMAASDFHPDETDAFRAFVDDVFEEGRGWTDDLSCRSKGGDRIPVEISASRIELADRDCLLAIVRDVSDRQRRERALRRLYRIAADTDRSFDEKLQSVFDLGVEFFDLEVGGMAVVDPEADRFEVEVTSVEHEDLSPGAVYPLSETYCRECVGEEEIAGVTGPRCEEYAGKLCYDRFGVRSYVGTYLEVEGDDDRTFWFLSHEPRDEPFTPTERSFLHLMGQWVRYELEREGYEAELEETVERLQQSNDRLAQFAYAASHDLQEPLRMISTYLQLLEREYAEDLDEAAREYVDVAVDGADRMRDMVEDLLAYSRVERSDQQFQPVDCGVLLDRVTHDLRVQIEEADAEVVVGDLPTVLGDVEQLELLFRNLLSNAVKYCDEEVPRVEVTATECEDGWEVAVADNGIGIEPADTERIFEVFKRLHHQDEYSGTGVGLALCQEIAEHHGGEIDVESEPGEGSTFSVTLPAARSR